MPSQVCLGLDSGRGTRVFFSPRPFFSTLRAAHAVVFLLGAGFIPGSKISLMSTPSCSPLRTIFAFPFCWLTHMVFNGRYMEENVFGQHIASNLIPVSMRFGSFYVSRGMIYSSLATLKQSPLGGNRNEAKWGAKKVLTSFFKIRLHSCVEVEKNCQSIGAIAARKHRNRKNVCEQFCRKGSVWGREGCPQIRV